LRLDNGTTVIHSAMLYSKGCHTVAIGQRQVIKTYTMYDRYDYYFNYSKVTSNNR
jgi:hypothetical protein